MKSGSEQTIFFATDLHGSDRCIKKFLAAASFYGASLLVLGGDLVGKQLVLIRKRANGTFEVEWGHEVVRLTTDAQLREFEQRCADAGAYTTLTDDGEAISGAQGALLLEQAAYKRLESWMNRAVDKLAGTGVQVMVIPGNDDPPCIDEVLKDNEVVLNIDRRVVTLEGGLQVAGLGGSTPTPWHTYREYTDEEIALALDQTLQAAKPELPLIASIHVPPYGSGLDTCPVLDEELRPVLGPGGTLTAPVGSKAVYQALLSYRPILGLFGHIHEGRGCVRIGETLCANPGSEYWQGKLLGVLVKIKNAKIRHWLLTEG